MLVRTRRRAHPDCLFCGDRQMDWLHLTWHDDGVAGVSGDFACPRQAEGYPGLVHGGLTAGLIDAAMTNALFARGIEGLTGRLTIRYHQPLRLGASARIQAQASEKHGAWWVVTAEIRQAEVVAVSAEAWFKERPTSVTTPATAGIWP